MDHDVFISHASDDKESLVDPLVDYLSSLGLDVWYDKISLEPGESLSRSIDNGLVNSRFALVVLSPAFLKKPWPEYELRGLVAREIGQEKVIIPIWFDVSHSDVLKYSPSLADKFALNANDLSIPRLTLEIVRVVRPDVHESILRWIYWTNRLKKGKPGTIKRSELKPPPIRHAKLSFGLRLRSKMIVHTIGVALGLTLDSFVDNLKRDLRPEREV